MKYGNSKAPLTQEAWLTRNALLLCAGVFFSLMGKTTGGITVKRSPEASALYWPLEDIPQYTFEPFPFRLHEATKSSADHAIEQWSFRKARQFRPRLLKRRQQLRTDSSEIAAVAETTDFGVKIPTRRIIDLSQPTDQEAVASSDNVRVIRRPVSVAFQRPERKTATSHSSPELPSSDVALLDLNKSISGGWVPVTEAPQVVTTGKATPDAVESQVNQSQFVRSPPEISRRKLFNNTFNATTQKKKEEYWVSKIENAEIYKHSLPTRNTTNVLLNRLYARFGLNSTVQTQEDASTTPEQPKLQQVTVEPVVSPSSSSVIVRGAANRTRLRVNRRPALSFTVQNPFSLGFLQVNITPPEPTPEPPHYDVEPSHRIDDTLDFQSVELDKGEIKKEQVQESQIVLNVNPVVKEPEVQPASEKPDSNLVTNVLANELSSTAVTERGSSSGATSAFPVTAPVANATQHVEIAKSETVTDAVKEVTEEPESADSRMFIPTSVERLIKGGSSDSNAQLQIGESQSDRKSVVDSVLGAGLSQAPELRVNDSRSDESFQAVDAIAAMFAVESEVVVSRPTHNNSSISGSDLAQRNISLVPLRQNVNVTAPIDAAIEMPHLVSAIPGHDEMKPNGVVVVAKNATIDKQPQGIVGVVNFNTNASETVNATEGHKLELATQSVDDFLFELPQSEVEVLRDSKRSRNNWTVRNDDLSRFNEEQRKIAPTVVGDEHDGAPEKVQNGTSVYFIGIIGIIPLAGGALYLAKILNRKRRERLHDSDTASVTGFRRGNALLHPLHLGQKKLLKASGKHEGLDIIPQSRVSPWEFSRSKLKLMSVIGEGNFGQVWKAEAEEICGFDGRLIVAVKTIKEGATWREKEELLKEIQLMEQLGPHQNVVSILGCCTDHEPYYLIMEYVMAGRLLTYLRNHKLKKTYYNFSRDQENLSSRDLTSICYNVAKGMEFIASKGIIHRDLAARNVLIDHHKVAKVADFGLSRSVRDTGSEIYEQRSKGALPIRWMAPESLSQSLFTQKSDVWSFGIFIWEVITLGSTPYPGLSAREVMRRVREGSRLERPPHCKPELYKITTKCWATDPARRPDFSELRLELSKALDGSNDYVDFDKFHESHYCHLTPIKEGEEKL